VFTAVSIFTLITLAACGSKKSGQSFSSVRGDTTTSVQHTLGECSRINFADINMYGQVGTYYDPSTRKFREDYINMNLTSVPAAIFTSTVEIRFYRWLSQATGQRQTNQIPVVFYYVDKLTGASTIQAPVDRISKATIENAITTLGKGWLNVTKEKFFDRVMIVLTGIATQYNALTLAYYNSAVGAGPVYQSDVLLPPFYVDPNIYKNKGTPLELLYLHPNYSYIDSNATEADYLGLINSICYELSGNGTRIPLSLIHI